MDIRHPFKDLDQQLIDWAIVADIPVLALLTKADKLKSGARKATLLKMRDEAKHFDGDVKVELFSSLKGIGVDVLEKQIAHWYALEDQEALAAESVDPTEAVES